MSTYSFNFSCVLYTLYRQKMILKSQRLYIKKRFKTTYIQGNFAHVHLLLWKKEMLLIFLSFINKTSLNLETEDKSQQKQQIQHFKADTIHPIHHKYYKADLTPFRAQHSFSPVGVCYNAYYSGQPLGFILPCTFLLS